MTATTDYRPLDFQITGTVQTNDVHPYSLANGPATDNFSGTFTATGRITYDANGGQSGSVRYNATGTGTSEYTATRIDGDPDVTIDYSATESGNLTFRDSNGSWTTTNTFSRLSIRTTATSTASERIVLGPSGMKLNFDPSSMSVSGGWASQSGTNSTSGSLVGTVTQPGAGATDLAISDVKLIHHSDGYETQFNVTVSGALMTPPDKASPGAIAKVLWADGTGRTEDSGVTVDVNWNAGKVAADVTGLEAPDWATAVKVVVDANGWTESASLSNNSGAADIGSAERPDDPTSPPPTSEPDPSTRIPIHGQSGPAVVDVYGPSGQLEYSLKPYGDDWRGGISVAAGDVTGDGVMDIITGAGSGGGPHIKIFDGVSGSEIGSFFAFDSNFGGGVNVAAGDVDGDNHADIIVGAGAGGAAHVKVFDGLTGEMRRSFFAFEASGPNGVSVAAGDMNGDGRAEIITGTGVGEQPEVRVWNEDDSKPLVKFNPYDPNFRTGASVATRTLPDGRTVIVTSVPVMYDLPERQFNLQGKEV